MDPRQSKRLIPMAPKWLEYRKYDVTEVSVPRNRALNEAVACRDTPDLVCILGG